MIIAYTKSVFQYRLKTSKLDCAGVSLVRLAWTKTSSRWCHFPPKDTGRIADCHSCQSHPQCVSSVGFAEQLGLSSTHHHSALTSTGNFPPPLPHPPSPPKRISRFAFLQRRQAGSLPFAGSKLFALTSLFSVQLQAASLPFYCSGR